jgi:Mrp family chromosome partitioning ATPase
MQSVEESFRLLRVRVQHAPKPPSFIVVGAALSGDGATFVACGLARAFAEAGQETLLLDANPRNSGIADELEISFRSSAGKPERVAPNLSVASIFDQEERMLEDDVLSGIVSHVRSQYQITIVDSPVIPKSGAAMQIARAADGLLVAVRLGRRPAPEDLEMKLLMQPGGMLGDKLVTGVVPTRAVKRRSPARESEFAVRSPRIDVGTHVVTRIRAVGH